MQMGDQLMTGNSGMARELKSSFLGCIVHCIDKISQICKVVGTEVAEKKSLIFFKL